MSVNLDSSGSGDVQENDDSFVEQNSTETDDDLLTFNHSEGATTFIDVHENLSKQLPELFCGVSLDQDSDMIKRDIMALIGDLELPRQKKCLEYFQALFKDELEKYLDFFFIKIKNGSDLIVSVYALEWPKFQKNINACKTIFHAIDGRENFNVETLALTNWNTKIFKEIFQEVSLGLIELLRTNDHSDGSAFGNVFSSFLKFAEIGNDDCKEQIQTFIVESKDIYKSSIEAEMKQNYVLLLEKEKKFVYDAFLDRHEFIQIADEAVSNFGINCPLFIRVVERVDGNRRILKLSQTRKLTSYEVNSLWQIPFTVVSKTNPNQTIFSSILTEKEKEFVIENIPEGDWIKVNVSTVGFFRVCYSKEMLQAFEPDIEAKIRPIFDRLTIANDMVVLLKNGLISADRFLSIFISFKDETDYNIWKILDDGIAHLQKIMIYDATDFVYNRFASFIHNFYQKLTAGDYSHEDKILYSLWHTRLAALYKSKNPNEAVNMDPEMSVETIENVCRFLDEFNS